MLDPRDYPELDPAFLARHPADDPRFEPWLEARYGARDDQPEAGTIAYQDEETATLFVARAWMLGSELTKRFGLEAVGRELWNQFTEVDWRLPSAQGGRIVWGATYLLYTNVFEPNAGSSLGHLNEGSEFETAVYMFWDMATWYPGTGSTEAQRASFLRICERALASTKASVQESALHGLGHATSHMPEASTLARRFVAEGKTTRPELFEYADKAARGAVQ